MRRLSLLVLAACSEHGASPPPPDIPEPPPPFTGPIAVHVVHDGHAVAGVRVVFEDARELPVAQETTDATGTARATLEGEAIVTVVDPFGIPSDAAHDLRTFRGARIGDVLELVSDNRSDTITVTVTAPLDASAVRYELHTTCGSGTLVKQNGLARGQITLAHCNGVADLLVVTFDANDKPAHSLFHDGAAVADGDTIALADPYDLIPTTTATFQGLDGQQLAVTTTLSVARGVLFAQSYSVAIANGVATQQLAIPSVIGSSLATESLPAAQPSDICQLHILDLQPPSDPVFVQLFDDFLPVVLERPRFFDFRQVVWSETSFVAHRSALLDAPNIDAARPIDRADYVVATLAITRGTTAWRWSIAAPHEPSSIGIPRLPIELADLDIATGDTVEVSSFQMGRVPGGYDSVRAQIFQRTRPQDLIVDPLFGRILFQELR